MAAGSGLLYGSVNVLAKPIALHAAWKTLLLYAASALFLSPFLRGLRLQRADRWKLLAMGFFGGGLAPVLLFFGLERTAATDAGLLLTFEMVATAALAFAFLGERFGAREGVGLLCLLATASAIAGASGRGDAATSWTGALLVLAAAGSWGIDNAVSARLVGSYSVPRLIAAKGVLGATFAGAFLLAVRPTPPDGPALAEMAGLGIVSIACSSLLFYVALRRVGAARTSAMNIATTALVGALGGAWLLHERLTILHAAAFALLVAGAWLLSRGGPLAQSPPGPL
jgi:drug/metabolite transporter (DMT)-like permease